MTTSRLPALFPGASVLSACAVVTEGDGRPGFYLAASTKSFRLHIHRVPDDAGVHIKYDAPIPDKRDIRKGRKFRHAQVIVETATARTELVVTTVSGLREAIEALQLYTEAVEAWQVTRRPAERPVALI